jgi:hypothetical protein
MNTSPSRRMLPALAGVLSTVLALAVVGVAPALAGPTVTVRIEGESATLLPTTTVTLEKPEPVSGCAYNSVAAAINLAVNGNWDHGEANNGGGDFTETILGETHEFTNNSDTWAEWVDYKWGGGICSDLLSEGDQVLMVADHEPEPFYDPTVLPLVVSSTPSTVQAGAAFNVEVDEITTTTTTFASPGEGTPKPAAGVTVAGGGASAITGSNGVATLTLASTGSVTLRATKPEDAPSASFTVCVHNGNDGNCGTSATGSGTSTGGGTTTVISNPSSSTAITARIGSLLDSHVYAHGKAPRVLSGTVTTAAALEEVELRLTRRGPKGRCSYFDGLTGRFHAMRCGASNGKYFKASDQKLFSYLLPETLAPGRYVLDAQGVGAGGRVSSLARGTSRIVFYVK